MNQKRVPVVSKDGKQLGDVAASATSIGASKVAHNAPVQFSNRFGFYAWVVKD